jgi:hypothetical protein
MVGLNPIDKGHPSRNVLRDDKHQNATTKRIPYGKEKQRRQNDSSEKARGKGAGWERDG